MEFYGALVDAEVVGDLFVGLSLNHVREHLIFARRESGEGRIQSFEAIPLGARAGITGESAVDGLKQLLLRCALRQKIFRAPSHRLHSGRNIPMTAEEDDWHLAPRLCHRVLQVQPV